MELPKDGATVRQESARSNRFAKKKQDQKEVDVKQLRQTIETGAAIGKMIQCGGWDLLEEWISRKYSFRELARIEEDDDEKILRKTIQRGSAFAAMQDWCAGRIHAGEDGASTLHG